MTTRRKAKPKPSWKDSVPRRKMKKRHAKSGRQRKVKVAIITATPYEGDCLPTLSFTKPLTFIRPICFAIADGEVVAVGANAGTVREWIAANMMTRKRIATK